MHRNRYRRPAPMPVSLIDSVVFRDIFSTEAMRGVFSDENRVQKYLDFEAALARAQARLGIIPKEAAEEICRHCKATEIDFAKLKIETERIGYPVLPVVQQLVALCRGRHAILAWRPRSCHPERADEGAQARNAGDRLAHGARLYCRGWLFPRARHRDQRQDRVGREALDADRGRGSLRAVPRRPRLVL